MVYRLNSEPIQKYKGINKYFHCIDENKELIKELISNEIDV